MKSDKQTTFTFWRENMSSGFSELKKTNAGQMTDRGADTKYAINTKIEFVLFIRLYFLIVVVLPYTY